jgi:phosphoribosylglycinamide formyltransferase
MSYFTVVCVISNRANAYGLTRAQITSIPTTYHNLIVGKCHALGESDLEVKQKAREKYGADLAETVLAESPDLIICAKWIHILAPTFLDPLAERKILHALPGKYNDAGAIKSAYDDYHKGKLYHDRTEIMALRDV